MTLRSIREGKISKIVASYLAIQIMIQFSGSGNLWALTGGPSQPEFNTFTPIGTSDMVNLSSGDFNYNIPIMDVGGYPLNLAYDSGITMDQEASWVGLGWNLNVGQINRQVRGIPDDFKGDKIIYENDMKENRTVGTAFNFSTGLFGFEFLGGNVGIGVQYNNYEGITFKPTYGIGFDLHDQVSVGVQVSTSVANGATISSNVSASSKVKWIGESAVNGVSGGLNVGSAYNSRQGLSNLNINPNFSYFNSKKNININGGADISLLSSYQTYTPFKRAGMRNTSFTFSASLGLTIFGIDGQGQIQGSGSYQKIRDDEITKLVPAFGYENTEANQGLNGVLDFNREKDRSFNKNTTVLPVTNYTHDLYSIQGQGISGTFRPFRSQTSYLYDTTVKDQSISSTLGVKFGAGWNAYVGAELDVIHTTSKTGKWNDNNFVLSKFKESPTDINTIDYEKVYFKQIGELTIDQINQVPDLYNTLLHSNYPIKIGIGGSKFNRHTTSYYFKKEDTGNYTPNQISSKIKRSERDLRNTAIQKITQKEAQNDNFIEQNSNAEPYHTVGMKILKTDGSQYVYGKAVYNTKKVEATFDVSGRNNPNCAKGTIGYNNEVRGNDSNSSDQYLNRITTPEYVHTYLLTSVLSTDYEDVTGDGPSKDDLGSYTLFNYDNLNNVSNFKWRIPYSTDEVSYNEGLKSKSNDQKGNYVYGEKELVFINKIETKTHVAIFELSARDDGRSAEGELKYESAASYTQQIDKIKLYSKPEYDLHKTLLEDSDPSNDPVAPIKTAHFDYDYQLCKGVENNLTGEGKLTLTKLFFTYRDSNMGAYTPYTFNYDGFNPDYNLKSYDIWGNYKPIVESALVTDPDGKLITNTGFDNADFCDIDDEIMAPEFPYVQQDDKALQDEYSAAWSLTSINLPSGGLIDLEYESDDYKYVQNRKAMQMFNVVGGGNDIPLSSEGEENWSDGLNTLFDGAVHTKYLYVKVKNNSAFDANNYVEGLLDKPIYFKFLLNMVSGSSKQYDYVSGYFKIRDEEVISFDKDGYYYLSIPVEPLEKEGGWFNTDLDVNPIAKAGWYFGRSYLNREVYSIGGNSTNDDFGAMVEDLVGSLEKVAEVFLGPNHKLQQKGCAREFVPEKSWVRLLAPEAKLGGGSRIKKIQMHDNWDAMTNNENYPETNNPYVQTYGQEYTYSKENGTSSGVASFEPNGSKENPFVEPFYDDESHRNDKLVAPKEFNYVEKPIGESFFPGAVVTYSRVEVKNLARNNFDGHELVKHATGKVVNEFYTTFDFPTISDYTDVTMKDDPTSFLGNLLSLSVHDRQHLTMSQGFVVETNDMNGKVKKQLVFAEGQQSPISGVEYKYSINEDNSLKNKVGTIDKTGILEEKLIGVHYDVVNDFRESKSTTTIGGLNVNVTGFFIAIFGIVVPLPLPSYSNHETQLRVATTTKVIHKSGILKEKIAFDAGSRVSTENIAWDQLTGDVLLTKTINEYDDAYYNFNYPAHWMHEGMGQAAKNLNLSCSIIPTDAPTPNSNFPDGSGDVEDKTSWYELKNYPSVNLNDYFAPGDEVVMYEKSGDFKDKYWVNEIDDSGTKFIMIDRTGHIVNECGADSSPVNIKIVRSHRRNLQSASMASITSIINPIGLVNTDGFEYNDTGVNPKIVNASAIEYSDFWRPQGGSFINVYYPNDYFLNPETNLVQYPKYSTNPFVNNIKGDWRAVKSYAYLTGRNNEGSPRNDGFFTAFKPLYNFNDSENIWEIDVTDWTFASEVTKYSPYGVELENKDALGRYSSAQYGYGYTLPVAVASNSKYNEIGFDGFEDYNSYEGSFNYGEGLSFYSEIIKEGNGIVRTPEKAHTGKYSVYVPQNTAARALFTTHETEVMSVPTLDCAPPTDNDCIDCNEECSQTLHIRLEVGNNQEISYEDLFGTTDNDNVSVTLLNSGSGDIECRVIGGTTGFVFQGSQSMCFGSESEAIYEGVYRVLINNGEVCLYTIEFTLINLSFDGPEGKSAPEQEELNKKYVVSAWVNEAHTSQQASFNNSSVGISYYESDVNTNGGLTLELVTLDPLVPTGKIIDGWQRIVGIVEIPESVEVTLNSGNNVNSYFDDVRIFPYNGNMKSFVYDEDTQRLMAELDENNYATFYEYDNEGGLVRVKKETEKGVYTIQETRSGNSKLNAQQ